jgi:signal transduction histidine kinase
LHGQDGRASPVTLRTFARRKRFASVLIVVVRVLILLIPCMLIHEHQALRARRADDRPAPHGSPKGFRRSFKDERHCMTQLERGSQRKRTSRSTQQRRKHAPARERAALEHEVARLTARLEELECERVEIENFAAMTAHEMLKPLVLTETCAALIADRAGCGLDLTSREELDLIMRVSQRVRPLVSALLTDARDNGIPLHRQPVDLDSVVRECLDVLREDIRARRIDVQIDALPVVKGHPALLTGVFGNLLANAVTYGPRDGGKIWVTADHSDAKWTFSVQSPGPPIPESDRQRIFEPWDRGLTEHRARGTGLGLSIVRRIVERHGGVVGVTCPSTYSNRFYFTLPA